MNIDLAIKLNECVHYYCENAPHNIGALLCEVIDKYENDKKKKNERIKIPCHVSFAESMLVVCPHCSKEYDIDEDLHFYKKNQATATKTCTKCRKKFEYCWADKSPTSWRI